VRVRKRWAAPQRDSRWALGGIAAVLAPAAARVVSVPAGDWLARHEAGSARERPIQTARGAVRGWRLALGAGLLASGALVFTARTFARSRGGQVTGRYATAIEQLGSGRLDVRLGGIYALQRIAGDSARHHPAVMEVLTAFIGEHAHEQRPPPDPGGQARERSLRPDVQAALTVAGRRLTQRDIRPVDLARADLAGANLLLADPAGADLTGADLTGADLTGAVLANAVLARAELLAAKLVRADLTGADLGGARLTGADLTRADLTGADLTDADLTGATLTGADLTRTELTGALWPMGGPVPPGWQRHAGSGQLIAAGTGAETAQANQPHG
jgi:Pentapeptide repeats (8 copies)